MVLLYALAVVCDSSDAAGVELWKTGTLMLWAIEGLQKWQASAWTRMVVIRSVISPLNRLFRVLGLCYGLAVGRENFDVMGVERCKSRTPMIWAIELLGC